MSSNVTKSDVRVMTWHDVFIDVDSSTDDALEPRFKKGLFRPTHLSLQWVTGDGDGWRLIRAIVSGPMLKKDGSDGQFTGDLHFVGSLSGSRIPEWVQVLIDQHTPTTVGDLR